MSAQPNQTLAFSIREAAKLCGLPESTLRYYESIGIIHPIQRDSSSKHRTYSEEDLNILVAIACLNATGMSIDDMRRYLKNRTLGSAAAAEQIELLEAQAQLLADESRFLRLRQRYLNLKINYWQAVGAGDHNRAAEISGQAQAIAGELKKSI